MKSIFSYTTGGFIAFMCLCCSLPVFAQKNIEVRIRHVTGPNPSDICQHSVFELTLKNNTDSIASFYENWHTWGYDAMQVELTLHDTVFILNRFVCDPSKNFPSGRTLFPGDSIVMNYGCILKCTMGVCPCFYTGKKEQPFPGGGLKGGMIRAVYQLNAENHESLLKSFAHDAENLHPFRFLIKPVSHAKEFTGLSIEKIIRSFVKDKLYSQPFELLENSW